MIVERLLNSKEGKYIISMILGFGLATVFRKVCKERNCLMFKAAPLEEIKNKVYQYGDDCYRYEEQATTCDANKKIVEFA